MQFNIEDDEEGSFSCYNFFRQVIANLEFKLVQQFCSSFVFTLKAYIYRVFHQVLPILISAVNIDNFYFLFVQLYIVLGRNIYNYKYNYYFQPLVD
jgi:hypothetical protein